MMNKYPSSSLIVSTYNWPEALELCLLSIKKQSVYPSEVIIADDGSTEATKKLIDQYKVNFPVPLLHVWQPDEGFKLSQIRNKAIATARKEYIIQIDGDLILHRKFVEDHLKFSKKGYFVTGSRVMINEEFSKILLSTKKVTFSLFNKGLYNISNGFRLKLLASYLGKKYRINDIYYMRGCNMAFWRTDLIKVNGYNEGFRGWGREDNEIAARLLNNGTKKLVFKFGGVVFNLFHEEKSRSNINLNDDLLKNAVHHKSTYCLKGLDQYL